MMSNTLWSYIFPSPHDGSGDLRVFLNEKQFPRHPPQIQVRHTDGAIRGTKQYHSRTGRSLYIMLNERL